MPRQREELSADHDSFLDIVSNIVGILIILVVLVGVRAQHAPVAMSIPGPAERAEKPEGPDSAEMEERLREEILDMKRGGLRLAEEAVLCNRRRNELAILVSAAEHGIEDERKRLDDEARSEFDLERNLAELQLKLKEAMRESILAQQEKSDAKPVSLEHRPTPISHFVRGDEIHLQLRYGRVAIVPFDKLVKLFKDEFERKVYRLLHQEELTGTLGPVDGFRLRYAIERVDTPSELSQQTGRGGSDLSYSCDFLPVDRQSGETIDEALADGSELRRTLSPHRPGLTTVTMWTYPKSFGDCQRLKQLCYQLGFSVAIRPLSFDEPISASNYGSRSIAQ